MNDVLEYHDEPVKLHSGGTSHWLVRGDLIWEDEHLRAAVLDVWQYAVGVHSPSLVGPSFYGRRRVRDG